MTLQELHERIGWQIEGRLQYMYFADQWSDWKSVPSISEPASNYRRRPDPAPMPDEVWISEHNQPVRGFCEAHVGQEMCQRSFGGTPVRYVRAGAEIPPSQIEARQKGFPWSEPAIAFKYRIKP